MRAKGIDNQGEFLYYVNDNLFHLLLEMRLSQRKIASALREHGYKLTPQRRAVVRAIVTSQDHLTPAALYQKVRQDHPAIGLATVYRTLGILARLELICELHAGGSCRSYTTGAPEHHHHLICSNCGEVIDFSGYSLTELEQRLARETGFEIEGRLLEFIGLCQNCQQND
jgi:Fur family ferric uptake transcriptional regulator